MFKKSTLNRKLQRKNKIKIFLDNAQHKCDKFLHNNLKHLEVSNYQYTSHEAIEELGLEEELINQLVEDFVAQILKSNQLFLDYLEELKREKKLGRELNYTPLRELAHKNIGVAKNLRIEDSKKILDELMKKEDLNYLALCAVALKACTIKLRPRYAYDVLRLIKIKNSL